MTCCGVPRVCQTDQTSSCCMSSVFNRVTRLAKIISRITTTRVNAARLTPVPLGTTSPFILSAGLVARSLEACDNGKTPQHRKHYDKSRNYLSKIGLYRLILRP